MAERQQTEEHPLGQLVVEKDGELRLLGWRSISLINISAVALPLILGVALIFVGGWWRVPSFALIAFSAYGCWAICRGATAIITDDERSIYINGEAFEKSSILEFIGQRVAEPSGMDDVESGAELWLKMKDGAKIPIIQMSGFARIEAIAAHLNEKVKSGEVSQ